LKKKIFTTLLLLSSFTLLQAQTMTIDNVRSMGIRVTSNAIKEGSDVKGYYFFYVSDKIDKRTNEYTLRIVDNNLKVLKDIKFEDDKHVGILECSFNGTDLMFLFYNDDDRTFEYKIYGADGKKKTFSYIRELTKKEKRYMEAMYDIGNDERVFHGLYPLEGKGFISNTPSREDKDYTFQIDYFSTEKKKQWSYTPTEGGKRFSGEYLGYFNNVVYFQMLTGASVLDQKLDSYVLGFDLETGKKLFQVTTDGKQRFYPIAMSSINGKPYMYGEYFAEGGNILKGKSKGFSFWEIDGTGKVNSEKYISWEDDLGKYLDVNAKGRIDNFGYMFLHNMITTANGDIYAVGEGFKEVASALGIAAAVFNRGGSGGLSVAKMKITDMILLKFDKDFNVKEAKIYDKNSNSIELPSGAEFYSTQAMAKMVKYNYGGFDYAYTQMSKDATSFTVCYSDYVKSKEYKGGTFNSISYNNGKITTDKIETKSKATFTWVLAGKIGQVLVMDYYKKDKKVEAHLEKLN
jgi:hypothetical protein